MRPNPKKLMAMSMRPDRKILVTQANLTRDIAGDDATVWRSCSDALATEIVPMTEEEFSGFVLRHGGRPLYPSLADYPSARG